MCVTARWIDLERPESGKPWVEQPMIGIIFPLSFIIFYLQKEITLLLDKDVESEEPTYFAGSILSRCIM